MMKVELTGREAGPGTLKVCGRVAECWVAELERAWDLAKPERNGSASMVVDLRGVSFVDAAGERLLSSMYREGARFRTSGVLIQQIVNQITGEEK